MSQQNKPVVTIPEKVIEYIGYSSAALEKAAELKRQGDEQQQKIAALIPAAVDALVSGERIDESQREKAAEVLKDPVKALEMLTKVAIHRNASEQALGTAVAGDGKSKTASANGGGGGYNSLEDPNVGARTTKVKQSSINLFKMLGLPQPSSE